MDNKYSRGKIYKITSSQTDKIYIGSTIRTLVKRFECHHNNFRNYGIGIRSCEILKYNDASIILIEEYPCNNKKELEIRERYYIENMKNVINHNIPTRTKKEWAENYKDQQKINTKKYKREYFCLVWSKFHLEPED